MNGKLCGKAVEKRWRTIFWTIVVIFSPQTNSPNNNKGFYKIYFSLLFTTIKGLDLIGGTHTYCCTIGHIL